MVEYLKGQTEIPGTEPMSPAKRLAREPLIASKTQKPCDVGLFSDDWRQVDLEDLTSR